MDLLALLTNLAENTHHQISLEDLIKTQSSAIHEALAANNNAQIRNIFSGDSNINFPDRDKVVSIDQIIV